MEQELAFAKKLAYQAGEIIKSNFDTNLEIEVKYDGSPVTAIDKQINQLVIDSIRSAYPDHGVLGEEADAGSGNEEYQWLCDPIDGTKAFILGVPSSVFMLALSRAGEVLISAVYEPHFDKMYSAVKGDGAFCNDRAIHVNDQPLHGGEMLMGSTTYNYAAGLKMAGARLNPVQAGGYKAMMIARGVGVATIRSRSDFHDVGPAALIVEEAGGKVTGLNGEPLVFNQEIGGVIISNSVSHNELVEIVKRS